MKQIMCGYAAYNRSVNESVREILAALPEDQIKFETMAFFHSIYETYLHLVINDIIWLKRLGAVFADSAILKKNRDILIDDAALRKQLEGDYARVFEFRKKLDAAIERFVEEIPGGDLEKPLRFKNFYGNNVETVVWKALLHWFNHQTHHRGNISVMLDLMGVQNDFSMLYTRI